MRTISVEATVDVDVADVVDGLDDKDLGQLGLVRSTAGTPSERAWQDVRLAVLRGDKDEFMRLVAVMAWEHGVLIDTSRFTSH